MSRALVEGIRLASLATFSLTAVADFPFSLAKIIRLGATDFTFSLNLNFGDSRRVYWEDALDAFPVAYPPNGKVCV